MTPAYSRFLVSSSPSVLLMKRLDARIIICGFQWYVGRRRCVPEFVFSPVVASVSNGSISAAVCMVLRLLNPFTAVISLENAS